MAGGKTASLVDAMNGMARAAMLRDMEKALAPIVELSNKLHAVTFGITQMLDGIHESLFDLESRIQTLEENDKRDREIVIALQDFLDGPSKGGVKTP